MFSLSVALRIQGFCDTKLRRGLKLSWGSTVHDSVSVSKVSDVWFERAVVKGTEGR